MLNRSQALGWCLLLGGVLPAPFVSFSQQNPQSFHGQVVPAIANGQIRPIHAMGSRQQIHFSAVLPLRNAAQLDELLSRVYDPGSPDYRRFLTVEEFTERFGPTELEYQSAVDYFVANGFTVDRRPANRVVIPLSGTVDQVERTLHVRMNVYQHPTEDRTFFSPDRAPSMQPPVAILGVAGLDDYSLPKPMVVKGEGAKAAISSSMAQGSGPQTSYLGSDMRAAYYGGNTLTGSGQTVALFQMDGYFKSDVDLTFESIGQSYSVPIVNVLMDGVDGNPAQTDDAEEVLDIVQTISMAPGLDQVRVYIGRYPVSVLNAIASDGVARQVSISWGWTSPDRTLEEQAFKEMAAQGQNVFAASGDYGAYAPAYQFAYPSEDPWVTTVGGTKLAIQGQGGAWGSEVAWSRSGGGVSPSNYAQPAWQSGTATGANNGSAALRNVPDVAMEADFDNYACAMSYCQDGWGGTSFAAPRWAGFMALVNEQATLAKGPMPGFINPMIYSLGKGAAGQFHDVTSGSNPATSDQSFSFQAIAGYDLVTGWGSPAGKALIDALAPWSSAGFQLGLGATTLSVKPGANGAVQVSIVRHEGFAGAVNLAVRGLPSGITASWSGNPVSDASELTLTAANDLPRGEYRIELTGTSGDLRAKTSVTLLVNAPGFSISPMPQSFCVNSGSSYTVMFTVNGMAGFADPVSFAIGSKLPDGVTAVWGSMGAMGQPLTLSATNVMTARMVYVTVVGTAGRLSATTQLKMQLLPAGAVVVLSPVPAEIAQGTSFTGTVSLGIEGNFTGKVDLSTPSGIMPAGVTATFDPATISGAQTSQMTLTASRNAAMGQGHLAFLGASPDFGFFWDTPLNVVAAAGQNFTLAASSASLVIPQGGSASITITVNPTGGFSDAVSLSVSGFGGLSGAFSANPTAQSSVLTIHVADWMPAAGYWLQFSGTSGAMTARGLIFLRIVPTYSFDMEITPSPISVTAGGTGSGDVTITPHGTFNGNVDLTVSAELPEGISAHFSPDGTQTTSSLLISPSSTVAAGNYQFNVTGATAEEVLTRTVTVNVAAPAPADAPDFLITATPPSLSVKGGSSGSVTVNLMPKNGFTEPSTLSCSGLPPGATCTFGVGAPQSDGSTIFQLNIATPALSANSPSAGSNAGRLALAFVPLLLLVGARRRKARLSMISGLVVFITVVGAFTGCGGAGSGSAPTQPSAPPPQSQTSTVTVSAVSQSGITHTVKITLAVY